MKHDLSGEIAQGKSNVDWSYIILVPRASVSSGHVVGETE